VLSPTPLRVEELLPMTMELRHPTIENGSPRGEAWLAGASSVAHEIDCLLSPILALATSMLETLPPGRAREDIRTIADCTLKARHLIEARRGPRTTPASDRRAARACFRILVIDDDSAMRTTIRTALQHAGFTVHEAIDGERGIEAYREHRPDLVITDIFMPEKEGIATMLEMRRMDPATRILAISGGGRMLGREVLSTAAQLGATATLAKPFVLAELVDKVDACLCGAIARTASHDLSRPIPSTGA
jgi:CheY-like chemotaxis protein